MTPRSSAMPPVGRVELADAVLLAGTARYSCSARAGVEAVPPPDCPPCNRTGSFWPDPYSFSSVSLVCSEGKSRNLAKRSSEFENDGDGDGYRGDRRKII